MGEDLKYTVSATIVTYNNDIKMLREAIDSFLDTSLDVFLYIVDNSSNSDIQSLCTHPKVAYFDVKENIGFGAGHNLILNDTSKLGKYHLILNPDVVTPSGVLEKLCNYMDNSTDVGIVMPRILNIDKTVQFLPKLFPTPINLAVRFFGFTRKLFKNLDSKYMLVNADYSKPLEVAIISGCFMFGRQECFVTHKFDERFFMYFEDFDFSRCVGRTHKLMMHPSVHVFHEYERGSHKNYFLFKTLLFSMVKYFNKYGWFLDRYRCQKNSELLKQLS